MNNKMQKHYNNQQQTGTLGPSFKQIYSNQISSQINQVLIKKPMRCKIEPIVRDRDVTYQFNNNNEDTAQDKMDYSPSTLQKYQKYNKIMIPTEKIVERIHQNLQLLGKLITTLFREQIEEENIIQKICTQNSIEQKVIMKKEQKISHNNQVKKHNKTRMLPQQYPHQTKWKSLEYIQIKASGQNQQK